MSRSKNRKIADLISGGTFDDGVVAASEVTGLHTVASTGNFNELENKPAPFDPAADTTFMRRSANSQLDMNNLDIVGVNNIYHEADSNTYMGFHASDQFRVVTGGTERLEVNSSSIVMASTLAMNGHNIDMNNNDIVGVDQITHEGDSDTWIRFHAANQFQIVTGGTERLEVNNTRTQIDNLEVTGTATFNGTVVGVGGLSLPSSPTVEAIKSLNGTVVNGSAGLYLVHHNVGYSSNFYVDITNGGDKIFATITGSSLNAMSYTSTSGTMALTGAAYGKRYGWFSASSDFSVRHYGGSSYAGYPFRMFRVQG